jgi:hypothetical protein
VNLALRNIHSRIVCVLNKVGPSLEMVNNRVSLVTTSTSSLWSQHLNVSCMGMPKARILSCPVPLGVLMCFT